MATIERQIAEWALGDKTGQSSKTMARKMLGLPSGASHPYDGGDFERCLGLLRAAPALRERLPEMREVSPYWAVLVDHWSEIEAVSDVRRCNLMRALLDPIERADPGVVRLGDGLTMRVR